MRSGGRRTAATLFGVGARRLVLIHWNADEADPELRLLRDAGFAVDLRAPDGVADIRLLRDEPPIAFVIDLTRLPLKGRDVAVHLRGWKATRDVPVVFVGGEADRVERVRQSLPELTYASTEGLVRAIERALDAPPVSPRRGIFDPYAGTPLPKKLGIREGTVVALVGAPEGMEETIGAQPPGARLQRRLGGHDLTLWFVRSRSELEKDAASMAASVGPAGLWIAWPKKSSGVATDLDQSIVQEAGLTTGLVDYKVASIDQTWSGLLFTKRRAKK